MNKEWQIYEKQVFKEFQIQFPNKEVLFNQKIRDKFSGSLSKLIFSLKIVRIIKNLLAHLITNILVKR